MSHLICGMYPLVKVYIAIENGVDLSIKNGDFPFWLVVLTSLKNMKVNGKDDIPYMKWKIKNVPSHEPALKFSPPVIKHSPSKSSIYFTDFPTNLRGFSSYV